MQSPATRLGSLSVDSFMTEYWQKRPVLLRRAMEPWTCPVSPADLLALACRDDADSRLVITADDPPEIHHGPFEPDDLDNLPEEAWTILVQEVDRLLPDVAAVQDRFRFLPNWRLDDVMISYAVPGGGVGAHIDQYDVFLIQGTGRRRWEIETAPVPDPVWRDDSEVAILAAFEPDAVWELEPGDVLYLPPGIPHNGIALEPCITLSVGCRAPDSAELLAGIAALAAEDVGESPRYADPDAGPTTDPGRIADAAREALRKRIRGALVDDGVLDRWLGRVLTEPVRGWSGLPPDPPLDARTLRSRLMSGPRLRPAMASQVAYIEHEDGTITLFVAGEAIEMPAGSKRVAQLLTGTDLSDTAVLLAALDDPHTARTVVHLVNEGLFVLDGDDTETP